MATIPVQAFYDLCQQIEKDPNYVLWVRSPDYFKQVYLSKNFAFVWGIDPEKIYKDPVSWCDTLLESGRAEWIRQLCARSADNDNRVVNYIIQRPDGSLRYIQDRVYYLIDDKGQQVAIAGICKVLTKQEWQDEEVAPSGKFIKPESTLRTALNDNLGVMVSDMAKSEVSVSSTIENYALTPREQQTLYYILHGKSAKEIAKIYSISPRTVEVYIAGLREKMGCTRQVELHKKMKTDGVEFLVNSLKNLKS